MPEKAELTPEMLEELSSEKSKSKTQATRSNIFEKERMAIGSPQPGPFNMPGPAIRTTPEEKRPIERKRNPPATTVFRPPKQTHSGTGPKRLDQNRLMGGKAQAGTSTPWEKRQKGRRERREWSKVKDGGKWPASGRWGDPVWEMQTARIHRHGESNEEPNVFKETDTTQNKAQAGS